MITRNFIETVHYYFDELNYRIDNNLSYDDFEEAAIKTIIHSKELPDAIISVRMLQYCINHWSKIEKLFDKKLDKYNEYEYEGNTNIELVSDDDAQGEYYITNALNNNIEDIVILSESLEDEVIGVDCENGRFTVFSDGDYYIKFSKNSSTGMKLFDKKTNTCQCNIVLSDDFNIILENNSTPYEIILYEEGYIGIYSRKYIKSLPYNMSADTINILAGIEWDILDENSKFGVSKLEYFDPDADLEVCLLFATSTFLIFQRYINEVDKEIEREKRLNALRTIGTLAAINRIIKR